MDNTELRPIQSIDFIGYFIDNKGFLYRRLFGRPRNTPNVKYFYYNNLWFILIKPGRAGKYKNYLRHNTGAGNITVSREVLKAFGNVDNSDTLQVNHKDRNTFNNHIDNLEWVTNKENCIHKFNTKLPDTYENMYKDWVNTWNLRYEQGIQYKPKPTGGVQKYDKDAILDLLANTRLSLETIAVMTGSSLRAVKYWQEKEKIKRYTLEHIIMYLLNEDPNISKEEMVKRSGSLVTSINTILRKVKCNDYRKAANAELSRVGIK